MPTPLLIHYVFTFIIAGIWGNFSPNVWVALVGGFGIGLAFRFLDPFGAFREEDPQ